MPTRIPQLGGQPRPANLALLLREAYVALNDLVLSRLAEAGHGAVRASHSAVFQYLDDTGTTVSTLAARAQITKQAMGELVGHLERHGYVVREPDPADRRAKLVQPTDAGHAVIAIAQSFAPELDALVAAAVGDGRLQGLRQDLDAVRSAARRLQGAQPEVTARGDGLT